MPWKSNFSTYTPSNSGSRVSTTKIPQKKKKKITILILQYSSRDDVTTDTKSTPRFSSISSPSNYRPSYSLSSGTYRSVPIKKDSVPTYTSRYATTTPASTSKDDKEPLKDVTSKKISPIKYGSARDISSSKYGSNKDIATPKYGSTKDVSTTDVKPRYTSSYSRKDPTPTTYTNRYSRTPAAREPSPSMDSKRLLAVPRLMSRDASPGDSRKSRDPSPAERFGSSSSVYTPSYRLYPRSNTSSYSSKYGSNSSIPRSNSTTTDKALSYMSATEAKSRPVVRKSPQSDKEDKNVNSEKESDSSELITDKSDVVLEIIEPGEMMQVTVVTRGTSPTPPSTSTFTRTRRADMAKTIEKTIQRPVIKPQSEDKEMQSDRMDDSTRYSRYGGSSRVSSIPWSSYLDTKYSPSGYSRYGSTSSKYSSSSSKSDEKQTSPTKSKENSPTSKSSLSRSASIKSNSSKSKSSSIETKSKSPIKQKQKSPDSSKCLPPMSPKAESPSKTTSNSSSSILKWTNKDFRKSALNMGSTDRPRTNRSNSTDSEQNALRRSERSSSCGSEVSSISTVSSLEDDLKQNKFKTSSSRGSLKQTSSCDDLPTDKPTQKTDSLSKNDETTKSFVSRAIAPVTKFFKNIKYNDSDDKSWLETNSATSISENIKLDTELEPSTTTADTIDSDFWASKESEQALDMKYKLRHIDSGDRAWWLCSNENLVEAAKKEELLAKEPFELKLMKSDSQSKSNSTETKSENVRKVYESDEKPWWMNNESESDKYKKSASTSSKKGFKFSLRHIESGETAWWLNDDSLKSKKKESSPESQISNSEEPTNIDDTTYDIPPLGDRASPEGLEDDTQLGRISPYDNIPLKNSNLKDKPKLFISRHTNIDDLLGGSCHLLSPVMDRITAKEFFEEITPDQVRIHDSTAQMPIIQRSTTDRFVSLIFF